jgi:hypothetical protein
MMDPFLPKEKFLPVALGAGVRAEFARVVFRKTKVSLCLFPCGAIRRPQAAPN